MKNLYSKFSIGFVCLLLGIIIAIQFKTVNNTIGTGYLPNQKSKELSIELKKYQDEKDRLVSELHSIENKIKKYQDDAAEENTILNLLRMELEKYKIFAGLQDVEGPGIIIRIEDPVSDDLFSNNDGIIEEVSLIVDYYDYILTIISSLNIADAEAISINGLRYTNFSELLRVGNHLNFNGISIGSPIEIKVIGPVEKLEDTIIFKGGVIDIMRNDLKFKIDITRDDKISISRYNRVINFEYAEPAE